MQDQSFYDDSSRALHMGHGVSVQFRSIKEWKAHQDAEIEAQLRLIGVACDEHGAPQVQHIVPDNAGAHDVLAAYLARGWHWKDALDAMQAQGLVSAVTDDESEDEDEGPKEGSSGFMEWCMRAPVTPDKRGSRSRSKKRGGSSPDALQAAILAVYGRVA